MKQVWALTGLLMGLTVSCLAQEVFPVQPKGEYAEIDNKELMAVSRDFYMGMTADVGRRKAAIMKASGSYAPLALMAMGDRLVRDGEVRDGLFWFHAGRMRAVYDADRCTDKSVRMGGAITILNTQMPAALEKQFEDTKLFAEILDEVRAWDAKTPYDYDNRWICAHGARAYSEAEGNVTNEPISKPKGEWEAIHKTDVEEYMTAMKASIHEVDAAGGYEAYLAKMPKR